MDKTEAMAIWAEVKANQEKLVTCKSHDFAAIADPKQLLRQKFKCTRCGGVVDAHAYHWYTQGRKHEAATHG